MKDEVIVMIMKLRFMQGLAAGALALLAVPCAMAEVSPAEIAERVVADSPPLLVDVRGNDDYRDGHIPGAINIPGEVLSSRSLPRDREIVLYGDGLGRVLAEDYAEGLRGGRTARVLRGGLAAWESADLPVTGSRGMRRESVPGITYQRLLDAQASGVTLVDLRESEVSEGGGAVPLGAEDSGEETLTDLASVFPDADIVRPGGAASGQAVPLSGAGEDAARPLSEVEPDEQLLVLIDRGDGKAEETARQLRASGNRRVVVLVGGETILRHKGRPGLERLSTPVSPVDAQQLEQGGDGE